MNSNQKCLQVWHTLESLPKANGLTPRKQALIWIKSCSLLRQPWLSSLMHAGVGRRQQVVEEHNIKS